MFDEPQSGDVDIQNSDINGKGCMFINSGVTNQGIKGYTDRLARIFPPNSITIDFFGNAYYRSEPYKLATHNHVFSFFGGILRDESVGLYLVAAMSYLPKVYSYGNMATKPTLKENQIILPTITERKPDFDYMRRYIATLKAERVATLKAERVATLKAYLQATGLSNTILTEGELAALDALRQNSIEWKKIHICGKDGAFDVSNTHSILKAQVVPDSGNIPYVGAGESHNSIQSYISIDPHLIEKGNSIMIGGKTLVITYQEKDYASNDSHNLALYYKDIKNPSRNIQLFLVSTLYRSLKPKYHWGDSISNRKIKSDTFMLPVSNNDRIDYDFINNLISAQIKLCIKDVLNAKDLEIATTERVIGSKKLMYEAHRNNHMVAEPLTYYGSVDVIMSSKYMLEGDLILMFAISPMAREKTQDAGKIALGIKETTFANDILKSYQNVKYIIFHYWKNETATIVELSRHARLVSPEEVPSDYLVRQAKEANKYLLLSYATENCRPLTNYDILKIQRRKERRYLPFISSLEDIK